MYNTLYYTVEFKLILVLKISFEMLSRFNRINRNINRQIYRNISTKIKKHSLINRLEYITHILKNRYVEDLYTNENELKKYHDNLKKEKNIIFKEMTSSGLWNEYMNVTREFTAHTYF